MHILTIVALPTLIMTMAMSTIPANAAHGFRSSFRDWCSEAANAEWRVAEMRLAHTVGGAVERAYARRDLFELRRGVMECWARFMWKR